MAGRSPRDIVPLSIGGSRIHVLRKTLCLFESSMLAAQFSGRWDDNVEKDDDGFFFSPDFSLTHFFIIRDNIRIH